MLFQASSPDDRISGASIRAYVHALGLLRRRGLQILADQGIEEVDPEEWYPWQAYLNAQRAIYENVGPNTVGVIGRKLVEESEFPPELEGVHAALSELDGDYRLRHRGKDVGGFTYEPTGERSGRVVIRNPYPCALDRQVVEALCRRFRPAESAAVYVRHGDGCRDDGAGECVLDVSW
jgi:hypothetical protein